MWSNFSKDVVAYLAIAINRQRRVLSGIELGPWNSSEEEGSLYDSLSDSSLDHPTHSRRAWQVFYQSINDDDQSDDDSCDSSDDEISILLPPPSGATSPDTPLPFQGVLVL